MTPEDKEFNQFILQRRADLARIRRNARNEHDLSDITHEAWLLACKLRDRKGLPIQFLDPAYQKLLISHLYNHLVRYTDKKVRTAARLEASIGHNAEGDLPTLADLLPDDDEQDPLTILLQREKQAPQRSEADVPDTAARAYVRLLGHLNTMRAVARHLRISISHAYRCRNRALGSVHSQPPVPTRMMEDGFIPGPWRRYRFERASVQLSFPFDDELPLRYFH